MSVGVSLRSTPSPRSGQRAESERTTSGGAAARRAPAVSRSHARTRAVAPWSHLRTSPQRHAPQHYPLVSHTHGVTRPSSPHGRRPCCQPGCPVRGVCGSACAVGGVPCGLRGQPIPSARGRFGTPAPPALSAPCPRARLPVCQP